MTKKVFKWWWEDPDELALYWKFRNMPDEEFNKVDQAIKDRLAYKYGNQYFFRAHNKQVGFCESNADDKIIYGNNSSGKSFVAGFDIACEISDFSPYREVTRAKFGSKHGWVFSPSYKTQRASSQIVLFALGEKDGVKVDRDIGHLPSLKYIKEMGGNVIMEDAITVEAVKFPNGHLLEFKTAEMSTDNLQGTALDFAWRDEKIPSLKMFDEVTARLIRKNGKSVSTFIEDDENSYMMKKLQQWEAGNSPQEEWFFLDLWDNPSLTDEEREKSLSRFSEESKKWRFSEGGKVYIQPRGSQAYEDMGAIHFLDGLQDNYDPALPLYRYWDLGYNHPCCIGVQRDRHGFRNYLFCILGENTRLEPFIDAIKRHCLDNMPRLSRFIDKYPHDGNKVNPQTGIKDVDIFKAKDLKPEMYYNLRKVSHQAATKGLKEMIKGQPVVRFDIKECSILMSMGQSYIIDPKTGLPEEDGYYEHPSDVFKAAETDFGKNKPSSDRPITTAASYSKVNYGTNHDSNPKLSQIHKGRIR